VRASAEAADKPSVVKVVVGDDGRALYFSRASIPFLRDSADEKHRTVLQHLGLYVYTRKALEEWVSLPPHPLERTEKLEQLRPLAHGIAIGVAITNDAPEVGIDTEEDLRRANERWDTIHAVGTHAE
jgi:3-deoxy-manno-octulosonate cytidylyltransferase (CMP-KDO synthetase)